MSSSMSQHRDRKGRLSQKSSSFHGRVPASNPARELRRPKTVPNLPSFRRVPTLPEETPVDFSPEIGLRPPRLTKLLLNVTIRGSIGAVQVIMSSENTVGDVIAAALRQYAREGRRPVLSSADAAGFGLHYSQFSLECLEIDEKLMVLGSRNFFLCPKASAARGGETAPSMCAKEAEKGGVGFQWLKLMDFML